MSRIKVCTTIILLLLCQSIYGQADKWRVSFGAGFPEFINIGIGYKLSNNNLISTSYGFLPYDKNSNFGNRQQYAITFEHSFLFGESKKFKGLKTWYFGQKLNYSRTTSPSVKWEDMYAGLDFGKQFNFSNSFGLSFDIGLVYALLVEGNYLDSARGEYDNNVGTRLLPSIDLQLFYRF